MNINMKQAMVPVFFDLEVIMLKVLAYSSVYLN